MKYDFSAEIWLWDGKGAWHFITLPKDISAEIKEIFGNERPGWGAVPVKVETADICWNTSIFPDKKAGAYLLPVKAEVRAKTGLSAGDVANITLKIRD